MAQIRVIRACAWPTHLNHPRDFNRAVENKPYVKLFRTEGDDDSDDESDTSFDDGDGVEGVGGEEGRERMQPTWDSHRARELDLELGLPTTENAKRFRLREVVQFLTPIQGTEQKRLHRDDKDLILGFCRRAASLMTQAGQQGQREPRIAIVDSRNTGWSGTKRLHGSTDPPQPRSLTEGQLYDELQVVVSAKARLIKRLLLVLT
jgi:hypothetical protein